MSGDDVMLGARIPPELKQLIDADPRDNQDIVRTALWNEFGGQRKSALEVRIEHKEERMAVVGNEMDDLSEEMDKLQREKEALEAKMTKMEDDEVGYHDFVDSLLDELEAGELNHLIPAVVSARDEFDKYPEPADQIVEDAKRRAARQDRELLNTRFMPKSEASSLDFGEKEPITDVIEFAETDGGVEDE